MAETFVSLIKAMMINGVFV